MQEQSIREILIDNIIDMAGDELESTADWVELAKKSNRELVLKMINLAQYYREQNNN